MTSPFRFAIHAITKHGVPLGERLRPHLRHDFWVSERLAPGVPDCKRMPLPMGPKLAEIFSQYDCHVFIVSIGAVIRMVAPLLVDKKTDPAVICIDDKGQYVIPILSGHVGRANEFSRVIADAIGAQAIITTASDVQSTLTVDILGRDKGWVLSDPDHNITRGCAAVVNEENVLIVQETGEPDFWPLDKQLPKGVGYSTDLASARMEELTMMLLVSDRKAATLDEEMFRKAIVYHPKSLVVGIGCDKGTPLETLEEGLMKTLDERGLALQSIKAVATIDIKKDEPGLRALCERYGWPLIDYAPDYLDATEGITEASETVKKYTGSRTVAEGAALRASGARTLLVPKQKYNGGPGTHNMTVAIGRIPFPSRLEGVNT